MKRPSPSFRPRLRLAYGAALLFATFAVGGASCSVNTVDSVSGVGGSGIEPGSVGFAVSVSVGSGVSGIPLLADGVAAGSAHACAKVEDGTASCWGDGSLGQLGDGDPTDHFQLVSHPVSNLAGVVAVRAGGETSCAIHGGARNVSCWGSGAFGELGDGVSGPGHVSAEPVLVKGLDDVIGLSLGGSSVCAVRGDGAVLCWGRNDADGRLGFTSADCGPYPISDDDPNPAKIPCESAPRQVPSVKGAVSVATSGGHTCVVDDDGVMRCWGDGSSGQLGDGTAGEGHHSTDAIVVAGLGKALDVAVGDAHSCALLADKDATVACWGDGTLGQLGNGIDGPKASVAKPLAVQGVTKVITIDARGGTTCVSRGDGGVQCWGEANDVFPMLADPMQPDVLIPSAISGLTGVAGVSLGTGFACVHQGVSRAVCWGSNDRGQLGTGSQKPIDYSFGPVVLPE